MSNSYNDIIELSRPESRKHPHMTMEQRAAQFSPFEAMHGHIEAVSEAEMEDIDATI